MREITWDEAIEIAKRRRDNMNGKPLYVVFNGLKGDFDSLRNFGIVGQLEMDETGECLDRQWYVNTGTSHIYLLSNSTVWVG